MGRIGLAASSRPGFAALSRGRLPRMLALLLVSLGVAISAYVAGERYLHGQLLETHNRAQVVERDTERIRQYGLALTDAARLAARTGDISHERRYHDLVPELDKVIAKVVRTADSEQVNAAMNQTTAANQALIKIEARSLVLTKQGRGREALALLTSREYLRQELVYAQGFDRASVLGLGTVRADIDRLHSYRSLVRFIGGLLGLVLMAAWLFAYYRLAGPPVTISVRRAIGLVLGLIGVLLLALLTVTTLQLQTADERAEAESRRSTSLGLAEGLRQSSNDLTRMVRLYVSTGEARYRAHYQEILDIRNGRAPRPVDYDNAFWDRVVAGAEGDVAYGPPRALVDLLRDADFAPAEFAALKAGKSASDRLAMGELEVMAKMRDRVDLPVRASETAILHPLLLRLKDERYHAAKGEIMNSIQMLVSLVDSRTAREVATLRSRGDLLTALQLAIIALMGAVSVGALVAGNRRIVRPLRSLTGVTREIAAGDYGKRVEIRSLRELEELGGRFNEMGEAIQRDITERRRRNEENGRLAAIVRSSDDAILAKDLDGVVTAWNEGAEKLYGYAASEAIGTRLVDLFVPAERADEVTQIIRGLEQDQPLSFETQRLTKSGRLLDVSLRSFPIRNTDGRVVGGSITEHDITDRRQRDETLRKDAEGKLWRRRVEEALAHGRMKFWGQPIVDAQTGSIHHHELLIRMEFEGETLSPGKFLPHAERTDLIAEVDQWAVTTGVEAGSEGPVAINLSARSLANPRLIADIRKQLDQYGTDPADVTFEITETTAAENLPAAQKLVEQLRQLGCGVAVDDFGTGYSSFTYLKHLPVTQIKIDMSFIHGLLHNQADQRVVKSIVMTAHNFEIETVAEGVEDAETASLLRKMGVDLLQGYHLGQPGPLDARVGFYSTAL
jgi:PAS domain S-box-containing protein